MSKTLISGETEKMSILTRLVENKHITLAEAFILNEKEEQPQGIAQLFPHWPAPAFPLLQPGINPRPFWQINDTPTITCANNNTTSTLSK